MTICDNCKMKNLKVYTDASTLTNPGPGALACLVIDCDTGEHTLYLKKSKNATTSNRAEMAAFITPFWETMKVCKIDLYSDSKYLVENADKRLRKWVSKNGRKYDGTPVSNWDLWKRVWVLSQHHLITFNYVQGHSGVWGNEIVNLSARQMLNETPDLSLVPENVKIVFM